MFINYVLSFIRFLKYSQINVRIFVRIQSDLILEFLSEVQLDLTLELLFKI